MNNEFVYYLNNLHSYNAQNENAYAEKNIASKFFKDIAVKVDLCDYIINILKGNNPQTIILTGHAGDGKTSIMYQVLREFNIDLNINAICREIDLGNGKKCKCIKDFSELSEERKKEELKDCLEYSENGNFSFVVANTGPLINAYGELFENKEESLKYKTILINAMDLNDGKIVKELPHKINIINVAMMDNTYFAKEFLKNVVKDSLWEPCINCVKNKFCPIYKNYQLLKINFSTSSNFIEKVYIWIYEHNDRMTLRSMTEQLTFMLTGGLCCDDVTDETNLIRYLYCNLFFGYKGLTIDEKALRILAISKCLKWGFDNKKLYTEEAITLKNDLNILAPNIFHNDLKLIIQQYSKSFGYYQQLRRIYLFMNCETDENIRTKNDEAVFSLMFRKFLNWRQSNNNQSASKPSKNDIRFILDALSMIFTGMPLQGSKVLITYSREYGIQQNVQLVIGEIPKNNFQLITCEDETTSNFNSNRKKYNLKLQINNKVLNTKISLPLLNYFDDLKDGIISTNIDPQLSHGIENLKSEISKMVIVNDSDSTIKLMPLSMPNNSFKVDINENDQIEEVS